MLYCWLFTQLFFPCFEGNNYWPCSLWTYSRLLTNKCGKKERRPQRIFSIKEEDIKKPWNTSDTWLIFSQIESIFLRINYRMHEQQYWKHWKCKLAPHCGNELQHPSSSPMISMVGTVEGSSPNIHHRR